eukprot:353017-Chlamydomonas_euryale.AAC.10
MTCHTRLLSLLRDSKRSFSAIASAAGAYAFKCQDLAGLAGLKAPASKRIKNITNVATQVTAAVGGGGRGRDQQKIWKCNGIFKKLTKSVAFNTRVVRQSCWHTAWQDTSHLVVAMAGRFHVGCAAWAA